MSRACLRSCASSSRKLAKTICSSQRMRPHGVSFVPGSRGIRSNVTRGRPGHSAFVGRLGVAGREEGPDPARLARLEVHEHRVALLLDAAVGIVEEDRPADQDGVLAERLDLLGAGPGTEAVADVAHPLAETLAPLVVAPLDAERYGVDFDLRIGEGKDRLRARAIPGVQPFLRVDRRRHHPTIGGISSRSRRTSPVAPSTCTRAPSGITRVATSAPTTAGSPYSRATTAAWQRMPPVSVTRPASDGKSGVQAGVVVVHTRTSPLETRPKSSGPRTTRASPVATPDEAGVPVSRSPSRLARPGTP